jgi:hypothetical protein
MTRTLDAQNDGVQRLVKQAKDDPKFFHDLIWKTEETLVSLTFLSRAEKSAILAIKPEDLVVGLATGGVGAIAAACGATCGASCGASCGATCGGSCGGSCSATCAASCGVTGALPGDGGEVVNPAYLGVSTDQISAQIAEQLGRGSFRRFRR